MGKKKKLSEPVLVALSLRFRALGEVNRLRIVEALRDGEQSVGQLVSATGLSQPNVSRHLKVLEASGLIRKRRHGTQIFYATSDKSLEKVCELVCSSVSERLC